MSISFTYTSLKTALQDWLEDDFTDFADELDNIIGLAELRCIRDLDLDMFNEVDTDTVTAAAASTISMAADAIVVREVWVNSVFLQPRSEGYVYAYDDLTADGQPLYWCQTTESAIRLAPTPDAEYSCRVIYLARPAGLSSTVSTTFLSTNAGDLLFAACRSLSEVFDKAPEDAAIAEAEYQRMLPITRRELRSVGRKDYP